MKFYPKPDKKTGWDSWKLDVDELNIYKLKIVLTNLSKLSAELDNDVVKKSV